MIKLIIILALCIIILAMLVVAVEIINSNN